MSFALTSPLAGGAWEAECELERVDIICLVAVNDSEIHQIVQKVLDQVLSSTKPSVPPATPTGPVSKPKEESKGPGRRTVAIGADHGGYELKEALKADLTALGFEFNDVGTHSKESVDYPDYAHEVAKLVSSGRAWRGIMIDGAGIGSCIVANKVPGVRAGMAYDVSSAINSREHNDANMLTLGAGLIGVNLAKQIVKTWLTTEFGGERHARRVDKIKLVEQQYLK
jgi:ribose 5-phosphate isomerase B